MSGFFQAYQEFLLSQNLKHSRKNIEANSKAANSLNMETNEDMNDEIKKEPSLSKEENRKEMVNQIVADTKKFPDDGKGMSESTKDCRGDSQDSPEAFFVPLKNSNTEVSDGSSCNLEVGKSPDMPVAVSFAKQGGVPDFGGDTPPNPRPKKRRNLFYRGLRKRKPRRRIVGNEPKVIVQMTAAPDIFWSSLSALRESDGESDVLTRSDDNKMIEPSIGVRLGDLAVPVMITSPVSSDSSGILEENEDLVMDGMQGISPPFKRSLHLPKTNPRGPKFQQNSARLNVDAGNYDGTACGIELGGIYDPIEDCRLTTAHDVCVSEMEVEIKSSDGINPTTNSLPKINENQGVPRVESSRSKRMKLGEIECVKLGLDNASVELLDDLYFILFCGLGTSPKKVHASQRKKYILQFGGYPFDAYKDRLRVQHNLAKVDLYILSDISQFLLGMVPFSRDVMEEKVFKFLMKPSRELAEKSRPRRWRKMMEEFQLKENILNGRGPTCTVRIKRLKKSVIRKYLCKRTVDVVAPTTSIDDAKSRLEESDAIRERNHQYPAYLNKLIMNSLEKQGQSKKTSLQIPDDIDMEKFSKDKIGAVMPAVRQQPLASQGYGKMLKLLPGVSDKIHSADGRVIDLIHALLFGSQTEIEKSKDSILNFTGFPISQQHLWSQRQRFLQLILPTELKSICQIFNVQYNDQNKHETIKDLLDFLNEPSERLSQRIENNFQFFSALPRDKLTYKTLNSFDTIRFGIECANPDDLNELHDVLYLRPCDSFEIHQRILEFSGFPFDVNSSDYYARKVLMSYMVVHSLRRIGKFLDLSGFTDQSHKDQLVTSIMKFLMEFRLKVRVEHGVDTPKNKAHIVRLKTDRELRQNPGSSCQSSPEFCERDSYPYSPLSQLDCPMSSDDDIDCDLPLSTFITHPTDGQIKSDIQEMLQDDLNNLSMNGLVSSVLHRYRHMNLHYRRRFIISTARKLLSGMSIALPCHSPVQEGSDHVPCPANAASTLPQSTSHDLPTVPPKEAVSSSSCS